jgi:hypothetical protein
MRCPEQPRAFFNTASGSGSRRTKAALSAASRPTKLHLFSAEGVFPEKSFEKNLISLRFFHKNVFGKRLARRIERRIDPSAGAQSDQTVLFLWHCGRDFAFKTAENQR